MSVYRIRRSYVTKVLNTVVPTCTTRFNVRKRGGLLTQAMYVKRMTLRANSGFSATTTNQLVFVMEKHCFLPVLCAFSASSVE